MPQENPSEDAAMDLRGKSAVVTGGGNGIGRALCLAFAEQGANVLVADIEAEAALAVAEEVAAKGVRSLGATVDVTDEPSVSDLADTAWETFSSVEILVNNAGVMQVTAPVYECSAADFDWIFAVNVRGALNGIRAFVPRLIAAGRPCRVANTASEHALGVPHIGAGLYTASKHAMLGLADVLRREVPDFVKVCALCPGIVDSTLWRSSERRTDAFGGSARAPEAAGAFMRQVGMPAAEMAAQAVEGIRAGLFHIVTHPHAVDIAKSKWEEIERAFASQAPRRADDGKYDLAPIMRQIVLPETPQ